MNLKDSNPKNMTDFPKKHKKAREKNALLIFLLKDDGKIIKFRWLKFLTYLFFLMLLTPLIASAFLYYLHYDVSRKSGVLAHELQEIQEKIDDLENERDILMASLAVSGESGSEYVHSKQNELSTGNDSAPPISKNSGFKLNKYEYTKSDKETAGSASKKETPTEKKNAGAINDEVNNKPDESIDVNDDTADNNEAETSDAIESDEESIQNKAEIVQDGLDENEEADIPEAEEESSAANESMVAVTEPEDLLSSKFFIENFDIISDGNNGGSASTFSVIFRIRNSKPKEYTIAGYGFLVLKNESNNPDEWLPLPSAKLLADGQPTSPKGGFRFSFSNFRTVKFTKLDRIYLNEYVKAVVLIYDRRGTLMLKKTYPMTLSE